PKQKIAVFLFRRSNPDAPAPVFEHIKTRKLRKSDKGPEEAPALSAHMFVRLGEIPDAAHPTYHAILEEVPGLSRTYIQLLLADVVKQVVYQYKDKRGQPKDTHTLVEFHGQKSEKVGGALKGQSIVPSVTLVRPANIKGLDVGNLVVPREERM